MRTKALGLLRSKVAARFPPVLQVLLDDLPKPCPPEAWKMPAMHNADIERAQVLQRCGVVFGVRMIGVVDERSIVNDVSREEHSACGFKQAYSAGRMARRMNDLENTISQVNQLAVLEQPLRRCRLHPVFPGIPPLRQPIEHFIRRIAVSQRPIIARVGQDRRFGYVHPAFFELMVAADMIEMRVAGDADQRSFRQKGHLAPQAHMAKAGVEKEIAVSPPHVPHVAAEKGLDPGLVDKRYTVRHADGLVPLRCSCYLKRSCHASLA